jgi:hypothetical protein
MGETSNEMKRLMEWLKKQVRKEPEEIINTGSDQKTEPFLLPPEEKIQTVKKRIRLRKPE